MKKTFKIRTTTQRTGNNSIRIRNTITTGGRSRTTTKTIRVK